VTKSNSQLKTKTAIRVKVIKVGENTV